MLFTGVLYVILGLSVRILMRIFNKGAAPSYSNSPTRISNLFLSTGFLNILIYILSLMIPELAIYRPVLAAATVIVFAILVMFESIKDYRLYRNRLDEIMNEVKKRE